MLVFGSITHEGAQYLRFIDENLNKESYVELLDYLFDEFSAFERGEEMEGTPCFNKTMPHASRQVTQ